MSLSTTPGWKMAVRSYRDTLGSSRLLIGFIAIALLEGPQLIGNLPFFFDRSFDLAANPAFMFSWLAILTVIGLAETRSVHTEETLLTSLQFILSDTNSIGWILINLLAFGMIGYIPLIWIESSNPLGFLVAIVLLLIWFFSTFLIHPFIAEGEGLFSATSKGISLVLQNVTMTLSAFLTLSGIFLLGEVVYSIGAGIVLGGAITIAFGGFVLLPIGIVFILFGLSLIGPIFLAYPRLGVYLVNLEM